MIYIKDQKLKNQDRRFEHIATNLDSIISSRLFEKGN